MEHAELPGTDLRVSRLALGCGALACPDHGDVDPKQAVAAVHRALELGVTFFDTADIYGLGESERVLSEALGPRRHDVVIVSKFGVAWEDPQPGVRAKTYRDSSPGRVVKALEGSLRRLRLERLPLYLVHWPDPQTPLAQTIEALVRCREQGKVGSFGVSNFSPAQLRAAHAVAPLAALEVCYSLLERAAEAELLPYCQENGIGTLVYGALAQGILTGKFSSRSVFAPADRRGTLALYQPEAWPRNDRVLERVRHVAAEYGKTLGQVALRWVLEHPAVRVAIVGATSPAQIEANTGALGWRLTASTYQMLAAPA
jgi:aryl-alcohol dehydrogenase-like predicted oxidoreductase